MNRITPPQWIPVTAALPEFTRRVPFLCEGESTETGDWHSGWLSDASLFDPEEDDVNCPWWCEVCNSWLGGVTQWFDLPLPEDDND